MEIKDKKHSVCSTYLEISKSQGSIFVGCFHKVKGQQTRALS